MREVRLQKIFYSTADDFLDTLSYVFMVFMKRGVIQLFTLAEFCFVQLAPDLFPEPTGSSQYH